MRKSNRIRLNQVTPDYSISMFAWFLFYRFDFFGIYVVMFLEILKTLLQVLCVFSILIVAFGLSFFMLMGNEVCNVLSTATRMQI